MPYKIPGLPSAKAYKEEIADFWEIQALQNPNQYISQVQISRIIAKGLDEIKHEGIESEDDLLDDSVNDVFLLLQRRMKYSSNLYPFDFSTSSIKIVEDESFVKNLYLFLLLCTRFNMSLQKIQNGIDGTLLFEELCSVVARNFFGRSAESYVFGTANPGNFQNKVNELIKKIGEGESFTNPNSNSPTKNDDSIDVIVWKEFADKKEGKLIGFGQCKTGTTTWRDDIHRLKPSDFCSSWFFKQPVIYPIPLIFLCDTMNEDFNFYTSQKGYLVFNRFRILEYMGAGLEAEDIRERLEIWLEGAIQQLTINS